MLQKGFFAQVNFLRVLYQRTYSQNEHHSHFTTNPHFELALIITHSPDPPSIITRSRQHTSHASCPSPQSTDPNAALWDPGDGTSGLLE